MFWNKKLQKNIFLKKNFNFLFQNRNFFPWKKLPNLKKVGGLELMGDYGFVARNILFENKILKKKSEKQFSKASFRTFFEEKISKYKIFEKKNRNLIWKKLQNCFSKKSKKEFLLKFIILKFILEKNWKKWEVF